MCEYSLPLATVVRSFKQVRLFPKVEQWIGRSPICTADGGLSSSDSGDHAGTSRVEASQEQPRTHEVVRTSSTAKRLAPASRSRAAAPRLPSHPEAS